MKKQQQQQSRFNLRRLASRRRNRQPALPQLLPGDALRQGSPTRPVLADALARSSPVKARAQARRELAASSSGDAATLSAGAVSRAAPAAAAAAAANSGAGRPKSRSRFNLRRLASRRRQRRDHDLVQAQPRDEVQQASTGERAARDLPPPRAVHWGEVEVGQRHHGAAEPARAGPVGLEAGASLAAYDWDALEKPAEQDAGGSRLPVAASDANSRASAPDVKTRYRQRDGTGGVRFDTEYRRKRQQERALRAHRLADEGKEELGAMAGAHGRRVAAASAMAAAAAVYAAARALAAAAAAAAAVQMLRYSEDELRDELAQRRKQELRSNFAQELQSGRFWLHPHKDQFVAVLSGPKADVATDALAVWKARGLVGRAAAGSSLPSGPDDAQPLAQLRDRKLASVFERHFDPVSRQYYFVNTQTMECSWSAPRHLRESEGDNGALLVRFSDSWAAVRLQSVWRARNSRRVASRTCCCIFDKLLDESSGVHYYWNKRTGVSTWDRPPCFPLRDDDPIWSDTLTQQLMLAEQAKLEQRDQVPSGSAAEVQAVSFAATNAQNGGAQEAQVHSASSAISASSSSSDDDIEAARQHHSPDRRAFARTDLSTGERRVLGWQGPIEQSATSGRRRRRKNRSAKAETVHDRAFVDGSETAARAILRTDAAVAARGTYAMYRETQLGVHAMWKYLRRGDTLAAAEVLYARPELARLREGDEDVAPSSNAVKRKETDTRPYPLHYLCTHSGFQDAGNIALLRLLLKEAPEAAFVTAIVRYLGEEYNGADDDGQAGGSANTAQAHASELSVNRNVAAFRALQATVGDTLATLLEPAAAQGNFNTGNIVTPPELLPLHLMCHNKSAAFDAMWELLLVNVQSPSQAEPMFGLTPLHCLCLNPSVSTDKMRLILQFAGDAARRTCEVSSSQRPKATSSGGAKTSSTVAAHLGRVRAARARFDGAYPIHLLCQNQYATPGVFEALHKNYKHAARQRTHSGATVLHYVCSTRFKYDTSGDSSGENGPMVLTYMIRAACATQHDVDAGDESGPAMTINEHARISDTARHANRQASGEAGQSAAGFSSQQLLALFEQEAARDAACRLAVADAEAVATARAAGKPLPAPTPQLKELREPRGSRNFFTKAPPGESPVQLLCKGDALQLPVHAANTALVTLLEKLPPGVVTIARGGASPLQLLCKNEAIDPQLLGTLIAAIDRLGAGKGDGAKSHPQGRHGADAAARASAVSGSSSMERAPFALMCSNRR